MVVAVGNSAGDLDTIFSSIAAAHLLGGVAMAPFPKKELALRRDASAMLKFCEFDMDQDGAIAEMLYTDEVGKKKDPAKVALTDHNRLDPRLPYFGEQPELTDIVAIFDHHADEGCHLDALPRDVDPAAGSACTLLGERLLLEFKKHKFGAEKVQSYTSEPPPPGLLVLVTAAIALDTRGFDPAQRKYSFRDVRVANGLIDALEDAKKKTPMPDDDQDPVALTDAVEKIRLRKLPSSLAFKGAKTIVDLAKNLGEARHDVNDLNAAQLLRMDFKQATVQTDVPFDIGIAGSLVDLDALASKTSDLRGQLLDLAQEKGLTVSIVMTATDKKIKPKKKAFVYVVTDNPTLPKNFPDLLEAALLRAPDNLSSDLKDLPLFKTQGILDSGFQLSFSDFKPGLRYTLVPKEITRKTMLPSLLHFARDIVQQQCDAGV